jgi:hypothetical protein
MEKIATPRKEKATPIASEPLPARGAKSPKVTKAPKVPSAAAEKRTAKAGKGTTKKSIRSGSNAADYDSPEKQRAHKNAGRTLEYDYGSVYCHQGCAGGFTGVLSGTARNSGMKR